MAFSMYDARWRLQLRAVAQAGGTRALARPNAMTRPLFLPPGGLGTAKAKDTVGGNGSTNGSPGNIALAKAPGIAASLWSLPRGPLAYKSTADTTPAPKVASDIPREQSQLIPANRKRKRPSPCDESEESVSSRSSMVKEPSTEEAKSGLGKLYQNFRFHRDINKNRLQKRVKKKARVSEEDHEAHPWRPDAPVRKPYTRGSAAGLDEKEEDFAAIRSLRKSTHAATTVKGDKARRRWWRKRCAARNLKTAPLDHIYHV